MWKKKKGVSGFHRCCIRVFRHLTSARASAWRKLNILWRCEIAKPGSKLYRMRAKQQFRVTTVFQNWNCSFKYTGEITEHHMAEWGKNKDPPNIQSILLLWHIMDALRRVHQFASRIAPCLYEMRGMRCVVTGRERHDSFFSQRSLTEGEGGWGEKINSQGNFPTFCYLPGSCAGVSDKPLDTLHLKRKRILKLLCILWLICRHFSFETLWMACRGEKSKTKHYKTDYLFIKKWIPRADASRKSTAK